MSNTWILCPNLWGARLFRFRDFDEGPKFMREFPRPKEQLRFEDFDTDDDIPELTERKEDLKAEKRVAEQYMTFLSQQLKHGLNQQAFENLIICAEPHLQQVLLNKVSPEIKERIVGTVDLDLYQVNESDLVTYVQDILIKGHKHEPAA